MFVCTDSVCTKHYLARLITCKGTPADRIPQTAPAPLQCPHPALEPGQPVYTLPQSWSSLGLCPEQGHLAHGPGIGQLVIWDASALPAIAAILSSYIPSGATNQTLRQDKTRQDDYSYPSQQQTGCVPKQGQRPQQLTTQSSTPRASGPSRPSRVHFVQVRLEGLSGQLRGPVTRSEDQRQRVAAVSCLCSHSWEHTLRLSTASPLCSVRLVHNHP